MIYKRNDGTEIEFVTVLENEDNPSIINHFKNKQYKIITIAEHTESEELCVVYQALYDDFKIWVRPADMFFSKVDKEKYPDVKQEYRFEIL